MSELSGQPHADIERSLLPFHSRRWECAKWSLTHLVVYSLLVVEVVGPWLGFKFLGYRRMELRGGSAWLSSFTLDMWVLRRDQRSCWYAWRMHMVRNFYRLCELRARAGVGMKWRGEAVWDSLLADFVLLFFILFIGAGCLLLEFLFLDELAVPSFIKSLIIYF